MADDRTKRGADDRGCGAGGEEYEALYLAEHTDISPQQARDLIRKHGNDRRRLMEIARSMKAES
jgi:hypothetical protein